jgi:hypothetical protein
MGFTELNIRSLRALIRARPELAELVALDLDYAITRLLDDNQVSASARTELESLRYGIAIARRN